MYTPVPWIVWVMAWRFCRSISLGKKTAYKHENERFSRSNPTIIVSFEIKIHYMGAGDGFKKGGEACGIFMNFHGPRRLIQILYT